jgi:hypothetical protein
VDAAGMAVCEYEELWQFYLLRLNRKEKRKKSK